MKSLHSSGFDLKILRWLLLGATLTCLLKEFLLLGNLNSSSQLPETWRHDNATFPDVAVLSNKYAALSEVCDEENEVEEKRLLEGAKGETVLVTGAAGFIGSHVVRYCAETLGMKVVAVDNLSGGALANVPQLKEVEFVEGDVKDAIFLEDLFRRFSFHYVYHLAAYTHVGLSPFVRSYNYRNNLVGSIEILNAVVKSQHKVDCFVFTSSNAVYGEGQLQLEETVPQPEDPYGISKYSMELDLKAARKTWGLDNIILRLDNVYGPNQSLKNEGGSNAIGIFMSQVLSGRPITIFGDGTQYNQFTYISDVVPIIAKSPFVRAARNQVINAGSDQSYTLNEVSQQIKSLMGDNNTQIKHVGAHQKLRYTSLPNHSKLLCLFHPPKPVSLEDGLTLLAKSLGEISTNYTTRALNGVEVIDQIPDILMTPGLEQKAKIDIQAPPDKEVNKHSENSCDPPTIAILISGQLDRFIYKDNKGPLVAWHNDTTTSSSSSWWKCGRPIVDVYIALHKGRAAKPWFGKLSVPPYIHKYLTANEIKKYYQEERGANGVYVKFIDDEHMLKIDSDVLNRITKRRLPKEYRQFFNESFQLGGRVQANSRMFYMRHLAYAMTLQQNERYSVYVSQREDAFFLEPIDFKNMGFDFAISTMLNGEAAATTSYSDQRDAKAYIFLEKWCNFFAAPSDKIHIGNDLAMSLLWGKSWHDFIHILLRWSEYAYIKGITRNLSPNMFQTEAFLKDLLHGAVVKLVDMKRVDMRYVDRVRCVPEQYLNCQPEMTKKSLADLGIRDCSKPTVPLNSTVAVPLTT